MMSVLRYDDSGRVGSGVVMFEHACGGNTMQ